MIVLLAVVAFVVTTRFTSILDMALYAYTMVGAAVTPALLAAFLWKRVTPTGGVISDWARDRDHHRVRCPRHSAAWNL